MKNVILKKKLFLVSVLLLMITVIIYSRPNSDLTRKLMLSSSENILYSQSEGDGQHDFDSHIGTWKTHLKRLKSPLSGSEEWLEYEGISVVSKIWNGKANLVELTADGPAGSIEVLSLRLYNPQSKQWSLNSAGSRGGVMSTPSIGEFKNGIGEFYNQEIFNGKSIFVRFLVLPITQDSIRFEQSFSDDGGKTWELNWIATDTRINENTK